MKFHFLILFTIFAVILLSCEERTEHKPVLRNFQNYTIEHLLKNQEEAKIIKEKRIKTIKEIRYEDGKEHLFSLKKYDEDGNCVEIDSYDDNILSGKCYLTYKNGLISKEISMSIGTQSKRSYRYEVNYQYDNFGKLTEIRNDSNKTREKFIYDDYGDLICYKTSQRIEYYRWKNSKNDLFVLLSFQTYDSNFHPIYEIEKKFNNKDLLISSEFRNFRNSNCKKETYKYDNNDSLIQFQERDQSNRILKVTDYSYSYFNDYHAVLSRTVDNQVFATEFKFTKQSSNNSIVERYSSQYFIKTFSVYSKEYISNSHRIIKRSELINGVVQDITIFEDYFSKDGKTTESKTTTANQEFLYYKPTYNDKGLIQEERFDRNGNDRRVYIYEYY